MPSSSRLEISVLTILFALLFWATHDFNEWLFRWFEFSIHVNWIYLPAFLRLTNVLVLGPIWGSAATGLGVCMIAGLNGNSPDVILVNALASIFSPLLSVFIFKLLFNRRVEISQVKDLLILACFYALMNAITHHLAWALEEPEQLLSIRQVPIMFAGDLIGACLGSLIFTALIKQSGLFELIKKRAQLLALEENPYLNEKRSEDENKN